MSGEEATLEKWFAHTAEVHAGEPVRFLGAETDKFSNPVGYTLKKNLAVLLQELLGEMDSSRTKPALEAIIRIRAIQDLTATQAAGFVFFLRPIVCEHMPKLDMHGLNRKIDQLALMAFEEYVRCREQLSEIRLNESRRAMAVPAFMSKAGS